ncbi:MAG: flagellar biosynthetic protein FliQ [Planctomycetota bacterium]
MDAARVMDLLAMTFMMAAKVAAPMLVAALVVGLTISLFQAVTQLNDPTISFLPKVVAVALALWIAWSWIMQELVTYTVHIFHLMEQVTR